MQPAILRYDEERARGARAGPDRLLLLLLLVLLPPAHTHANARASGRVSTRFSHPGSVPGAFCRPCLHGRCCVLQTMQD